MTPPGRLPPALSSALPVLSLLLACRLLVPVRWAHVMTGIALTGAIAVHLITRRAQPLSSTRPASWAATAACTRFFTPSRVRIVLT